MTNSPNHTKYPQPALDDPVSASADYVLDHQTGEILAAPAARLTKSQRRIIDYLAAMDIRGLDRLDEIDVRREAEEAARIKTAVPEGGWKRAWRRLGVATSGHYLEQKAKTDKKRESPVAGELVTRSDFVCAGARKWVNLGTCAHGSHEVASEIVCGREWCPRCGVNAAPGIDGSRAHRRRIARWLKKATQMAVIGEWVFTYPLELREQLRDLRNLADDGISMRRALKNRGYGRGMRRLHWFGEPENGVNGVPIYHPHWNVLVESGQITPTELESIKAIWSRLLRRRYGYTGPVNAHYKWADTPAKKYHRVRYVTRATFLNRDWDQQLAEEIIGFRNASTWGKWDGPALWEPEPSDQAPSQAAQRAAVGQCPGEHPEPVSVEYLGITDSFQLRLDVWQDAGEGFYFRRKRKWGAP